MVPFIVVVFLMLVFLGNAVPPMGLLGLAALIASGAMLFYAYAQWEKNQIRKHEKVKTP